MWWLTNCIFPVDTRSYGMVPTTRGMPSAMAPTSTDSKVLEDRYRVLLPCFASIKGVHPFTE